MAHALPLSVMRVAPRQAALQNLTHVYAPTCMHATYSVLCCDCCENLYAICSMPSYDVSFVRVLHY
eukprot:44516-Eustigmatos_ZCMA.PRE.1